MAEEAKPKAVSAYDCIREVPDLQNYKCKICKATYNNMTFHVADERDCPVCDNRDCAQKI